MANARIVVATRSHERPDVLLVPADQPPKVTLARMHGSYANFFWWIYNIAPEFRQHNFGIKGVMVLEYQGCVSPTDPVGVGMRTICDAADRMPPELRVVELGRVLDEMQSMFDRATSEAAANETARHQHEHQQPQSNPVPPTTESTEAT